MEAEFQERNKNLKQTLNNLVDKIDTAAQSTHKFLDSEQQTTTTVGGSSTMGMMGSGNPNMMQGTTTTLGSSMLSNHPMATSGTAGDMGGETIHHLDSKLMNSINNDIIAMHSTDPEVFESVATKFDETFGSNALV